VRAVYPHPLTPIWTGAYVGVNAGYLSSLDSGDVLCTNSAGANCNLTLSPPAHLQPRGFIGGAQIGYNWQVYGRFVLGGEIDFQGTTASLSTTKTYVNVASGATLQASASSKLDYLGTVRGRLGIVVIDPLLIYVTGGLAYGGGNVSSTFAIPAGGPSELYPSARSFNRVGYTIGGGLEYILSRSWTMKLEGLYYDLGNVSTFGSDVVSPATGSRLGKTFTLNGLIGRIGVNYKFDLMGPSAPVIAKY
jgi:outer membrane immunogenic protein